MKQILLIDDDPIVNFINSRIIQSHFPDTELLIFTDGRKGFQYILENPGHSYLIFLDLNMPIMNGWRFLEAISEEVCRIKLQIHILSSSIDPQDKIRARQHTLVSSYLAKPLRGEDLKALPNS